MALDTAIVKEYWSTFDGAASEKNFYCFPPIRARSCQLIFGESDATSEDWCEYYTVEKYLKDSLPFEKCLSICCGFGAVERTLARLQVARRIVGTDIAPGAIEQARNAARAENLDNIDYFVADLNEAPLPVQECDLIWANGALHHIAELDAVIAKLHSAMCDGGYLVSNEYVGPKYQQIGTRQQELVNAVKHLLPAELRGPSRCKNLYGNTIFAKTAWYARRHLARKIFGPVYEILWERPPVGHFLDTDPSECVNSDQIIPTLKKYFQDVEVKYYNGSILYYALDSRFYDNYDPHNSRHQEALRLLFEIEDGLVAAGEIGQDNAHIICRKAR